MSRYDGLIIPRSYSEYINDLNDWYSENIAEDFKTCRDEISAILQEEASLMEIVKLIGSDVLPDSQKLVIEIARVIRLGFLQQDALNPVDTYATIEKQYKMMKIILHLYHKCKKIVAKQIPLSQVLALGIFDNIIRMKTTVTNDNIEEYDKYTAEIDGILEKKFHIL